MKSPKNRRELGFKQQNSFVQRIPKERERNYELSPENLKLIAAMYNSGIAHMDAEITRLLRGLEDFGLEDETVVVLTSDHGESLGEHDRIGHIYLTDDNLHVPLVIRAPGSIGAGRRIDDQVRLVDVMPTILDLVGVAATRQLDGVSLVGLMNGESGTVPQEAWSYAAASNRGLSLRTGNRLKFILDNSAWQGQNARREFFDLGTDPEEISNLASDDERVDMLEDLMISYADRSAVGLMLRVQTGRGELLGRLRGVVVRPIGTKVIGMEGECLRWLDMGEADLVAPPDSEFTVVFEKFSAKRVRIDGEFALDGDVVPVQVVFDGGDLDGVDGLVFDEGKWRRVQRALAPGEIGLAAEWRGARVSEGGPAYEMDEELTDQLRALGYIQED